VRHIFREGIAEAEQGAVIAAAVSATRDLERDLKRRVSEEFATLSKDLRGDIALLYDAALEEVTRALAERAALTEGLEERRSRIAAVRDRDIPALRAALHGAEAEVVA
jgi:LPS O-antigen subunit length determinant protein (WzzB/FepE family)